MAKSTFLESSRPKAGKVIDENNTTEYLLFITETFQTKYFRPMADFSFLFHDSKPRNLWITPYDIIINLALFQPLLFHQNGHFWYNPYLHITTVPILYTFPMILVHFFQDSRLQNFRPNRMYQQITNLTFCILPKYSSIRCILWKIVYLLKWNTLTSVT